MSTAAQRLARLSSTGDAGVIVSGFTVAQVTADGVDPRDVVASSDGGATFQTMRCSSGYPVRVIDDLVLAVMVGQRWHVLGKLGALPAGTIDADTVQGMIDTSVGQIDIPPVVGVSWGQGPPPGAAWLTGTTTYVRDEGSGARQIYVDTATGSGGSTPPPLPGETPAPVTVTPDSVAGWRGSQQSDNPKQGDAAPYGAPGDWVGGWFYGSKIAAACAGKSVKDITMQVSRARGGVFAPVWVQLGTHTKTSKSKPYLSNKYGTGTKLPVGGAGWTLLPGNVRDLLASGTAKGMGCWGSGSGDYLVYTTGCGNLKITFN